MEELMLKFNLLEAFQREEVLELINRFLSKGNRLHEQQNRWKRNKERLLKVSIWSEEDVQEIYNNKLCKQ